MCGGSLLNILIDVEQTPFWTEVLLIVHEVGFFVLYLRFELNH